MQHRIGLTGGIASGKSTVGRLLEQRGWPVLDADRYARDALSADSVGAQAVAARYGECVGHASHLDRAALGRIVFSNPAERRWLEQLVHPLVCQRFDRELQQLQSTPVVVLMIPLLFEAGLEALCSEIWLVDCDPQQQLDRLHQRDGLSRADAQARLDAQWPLSRKRDLADVVIDNLGASNALVDQLNRYAPAAP